MNTKDNQRTRLTKQLLKNATIELLAEYKSISKISVSRLCERAGLNRSTFYAHYTEPKDVLCELEDEILEQTIEYSRKIGAENDIGAQKYLLSFLKYLKKNDSQFRPLLVDNLNIEFRNRFIQQSVMSFIQNLNLVLDDDIEQYVYSYVLQGSLGVMTQWIRSDYAIPEEQLVQLLFTLNQNALKDLAK